MNRVTTDNCVQFDCVGVVFFLSVQLEKRFSIDLFSGKG